MRLLSIVALGASVFSFSQTLFAAAQENGRKPTMACEQLGAIKLKDVSSITAKSVDAGALTLQGAPPLNNLPAFCRVSVVIKPQINIEVWLPMAWNERFQAVGGGGYAGTISWPALASALRNGYATASTDTGHPASAGGSFALNSDGTSDTQLM